jgi:hypothetical protein
MRRRTFLAAALGIVGLPRDLLAQGAPKIARIGWLTTQQASALAPYLTRCVLVLPNSATKKAETLLSSTATAMMSLSEYLNLPPGWCVRRQII